MSLVHYLLLLPIWKECTALQLWKGHNRDFGTKLHESQCLYFSMVLLVSWIGHFKARDEIIAFISTTSSWNIALSYVNSNQWYFIYLETKRKAAMGKTGHDKTYAWGICNSMEAVIMWVTGKKLTWFPAQELPEERYKVSPFGYPSLNSEEKWGINMIILWMSPIQNKPCWYLPWFFLFIKYYGTYYCSQWFHLQRNFLLFPFYPKRPCQRKTVEWPGLSKSQWLQAA